jgi:hypothetical protein
LDWGAKIEMMEDFNHNFTRDAANLNVQLTVRLHPR